ncbi:hypothetical protein [Pedobacter sp. R20-19]|uniref:hypothetical protein n=1 Tax=Pedobacter sp. R20-19 TaxID=1270196 RepID=UPI00049330B9|nr:hypothetical protein [Pedobacter sp. R20-19]
MYEYIDIKIEYLNRMFLKRNAYYRKLEKTLTLFDDFDEQKESLKSQQESIIEKSINIPIEKLDFLYGAVAFDISVKDYGSEINFDIENLTIRLAYNTPTDWMTKNTTLLDMHKNAQEMGTSAVLRWTYYVHTRWTNTSTSITRVTQRAKTHVKTIPF